MADVIAMRRPLLEPVPSASWPEDIRQVPFADEHAMAAHALLASAYAAGGGSVPESFVDWWLQVSGDEEFDRGLCFVALDRDHRMAGFALVWTSGFIKDIAVTPAHRGKGLGAALVLAACEASRARGHDRIRLKVQANNPSGAQRLYARLGFVPD